MCLFLTILIDFNDTIGTQNFMIIIIILQIIKLFKMETFSDHIYKLNDDTF